MGLRCHPRGPSLFPNRHPDFLIGCHFCLPSMALALAASDMTPSTPPEHACTSMWPSPTRCHYHRLVRPLSLGLAQLSPGVSIAIAPTWTWLPPAHLSPVLVLAQRPPPLRVCTLPPSPRWPRLCLATPTLAQALPAVAVAIQGWRPNPDAPTGEWKREVISRGGGCVLEGQARPLF